MAKCKYCGATAGAGGPCSKSPTKVHVTHPTTAVVVDSIEQELSIIPPSPRSEAAKSAWVEIRRREAELATPEDRSDFMVLRSGYAGAYARAKKKSQLETFPSVQEAISIYRKQERSCALTGKFFNSEKGNDGKVLRYPWIASLDRKNPKLGYTPDNVRWTWAIVNMARNEWQDELFIAMCRHVIAHADLKNNKGHL